MKINKHTGPKTSTSYDLQRQTSLIEHQTRKEVLRTPTTEMSFNGTMMTLTHNHTLPTCRHSNNRRPLSLDLSNHNIVTPSHYHKFATAKPRTMMPIRNILASPSATSSTPSYVFLNFWRKFKNPLKATQREIMPAQSSRHLTDTQKGQGSLVSNGTKRSQL